MVAKSWGTVTKFEHFIDESEAVIDSELIDLKAKLLLEKGDFYDVRNYKKIIAHLESLKAPTDTGVEEANIKLQCEIKMRTDANKIFKEAYKNLIQRLSLLGLLTKPFEESSEVFLKEVQTGLNNLSL
jgi:hypothetical protein